MRRLIAFFGVLLALAGTALAAPQALARWRFETARATVRDVLLEPLGDGTVRLRVLFEFTAGEDGMRVTWCSFGDNQADDRLRRVPDPVVPRREAQEHTRALLGNDPEYRLLRTAYYRRGAPEDAFVVTPAAGPPSQQYVTGLALLFAGLLGLVFARPWAERSER